MKRKRQSYKETELKRERKESKARKIKKTS